MSTHDVPGHKKEHADELAMGCWAEHEDGSLILVEGNENGSVIYSIFDVSRDPVTEYRDAMPEKGFKKHFSWDPSDKKSEIWIWHDKTVFPWERVMEINVKDGVRYASARGQLNAAQRVAQSLKLRGEGINRERMDHLNPQTVDVLQRVRKAIDAFME